MPDIHDLTALELGEAIKAGELSPVEVVTHYLNRAQTRDDVGAFVTLVADRALGEAERLTALKEPPADQPLWGVPTAIKDLNTTAGVRTTFGSVCFAEYVPTISDNVTLSIEAAGMPWIGKTSTPEFGSPCYTEPEGRPPASTPYDRSRMAGGSSGGAGAAVAAGLVPVAHGSDGGGSIRIPASCCGLVGLKPSRGRISSAPMYGDPIGLATAGSLARTVRDAAALLDVLAGRRTGDPFWAPEPNRTHLSMCDEQPGTLRIGRFIEPVIADSPVDAEVVAGYQATSELLESLGHQVEDIEVPLPPSAVSTFETCWAVLTALSVPPPGAEHLVRPLTRWLSERGHQVTGPQFGLAIGEIRRVAAGALAALAPYDAVLTPTLAVPPLPIGALRNDADPAADFEAQKRFTPWTSAWNVTGMPAISLPLCWTDAGLPVGMMLAARPAEEGLLLALSAQVEEAVGGFTRRPSGW